MDVRNAPAGVAINKACTEAMGLCPHIWEIYEPPEEYCDKCGAMLSGWVDDDYPEKRCKLCGKSVWGLRYSVNGVPDCKPYSTDISCAYDLIESTVEIYDTPDGKIYRNKNGPVLITRNDENTRWYVEFDMKLWECAESESLPLAVCRAFLLANGINEIEIPDGK